MHWMIYGAYGYTGSMVVDLARAAGHQPIVAGRNESVLRAFAEARGLDFSAFSIGDPARMHEAVRGIDVLLNCAGPFVDTAEPLADACIRAGCHYADVMGEYMVIEALTERAEAAKLAGVVLCPAVGFDVVPTDCLAAKLQAELPDATRLTLALQSDMGVSKGSAKSLLGLFAEGSIVRRRNELVRVSRRQHVRLVDFGEGPIRCAPVPWGDLVTAWHTTRIPNIDVVVPLRLGTPELWIEPLTRRLLSSSWVRASLTKLIDRKLTPPGQQELDEVGVLLWGEVENSRGERRAAIMRCPNGYALTAQAALLTVERLLQHTGDGGYYTPTQLLGVDVPEKELGCSTSPAEPFSA